MLNIRLELARANYRACVEVLLPPLVEHCAGKAAPNELDRFLAGLGADAAPAACALLDELSADDKDRLIVWLVSAHEERLRSSANRHLTELVGAPIIRIGHFAAVDRPGSALALFAEQVDIDYPALLQSPLVGEGIDQIGEENGVLKSAAKLAVKMGMHLSSDNLEKQSVRLLNSDKVKSRLMRVMEDAVRQEGVDVAVEDVIVERSDAILLPAQLSDAAGAPPDAFGERLMAALDAKAKELRRQG